MRGLYAIYFRSVSGAYFSGWVSEYLPRCWCLSWRGKWQLYVGISGDVWVGRRSLPFWYYHLHYGGTVSVVSLTWYNIFICNNLRALKSINICYAGVSLCCLRSSAAISQLEQSISAEFPRNNLPIATLMKQLNLLYSLIRLKWLFTDIAPYFLSVPFVVSINILFSFYISFKFISVFLPSVYFLTSRIVVLIWFSRGFHFAYSPVCLSFCNFLHVVLSVAMITIDETRMCSEETFHGGTGTHSEEAVSSCVVCLLCLRCLSMILS